MPTHPPFLPSPLSLQSAAKMKSLIRQRKDKKTLLVISLPFTQTITRFTLQFQPEAMRLSCISFCFCVQKMLSHISGKESFPLVLFSLFRLQASFESLNAYQLTSFECNIFFLKKSQMRSGYFSIWNQKSDILSVQSLNEISSLSVASPI